MSWKLRAGLHYNDVLKTEKFSVGPHCSTQDPGGGVGSRSVGWSWVGLGVNLGFMGWSWVGLEVGLGIRGWSWVGLGICKVGGVGCGSDSSPWISSSGVRTISKFYFFFVYR